ncbi:hypothetical protein O6H91_02G151400 [Diphasiastrum complanatum]|uniref:Uncharacterized protein n=1 Tax=Diphasiastrum complanatum TaxID=34168 RepID=A0ACC2EM53_DIPCM|nr:hypothetical protein O6H91_02G151400 [Diphasiastrum complanatum]
MDLPCLDLFSPSVYAHIKDADILQKPENFSLDLPSNMMNNVLSWQFPTASSEYCLMHERLGFQDFAQFSDSASKLTCLQLLENNDTSVNEVQGLESLYLKLPILEEPPDQKISGSMAQELLTTEHEVVKEVESTSQGFANEASTTYCYTSRECCDSSGGSSPEGFEDVLEKPGKDDFAKHQSVNHQFALSTHTLTSNSLAQSYLERGNLSKPKRRRARSRKNSEEAESQRQIHIAVERNRRKQMNEHLNILRSLMPGSYLQRSDQASIVTGAIEFVRELEHVLECLQTQKRRRLSDAGCSTKANPTLLMQPSAFSLQSDLHLYSMSTNLKFGTPEILKEMYAESKSDIADVEVRMVGKDALVKILSLRRPGQLLKTIAALENLCLTIMHTNITTVDHTVLYSFNVELEMECCLSPDEVAGAVQQIFFLIHNNLVKVESHN